MHLESRDQWVNKLYRIFLNSFRSTVQQDRKGIETNEKKNYFISDEARATNNTLLAEDNNGTQTGLQL